MNPTSNASSDAFSPCSITTICTDMPNYTSCLQGMTNSGNEMLSQTIHSAF